MRTINHESDFKIIEGFKDGSSILAAPFRFTYYTKVTRGVHVAEYDGSKFTNCHPTDDGRVVVPFDSPQLGMGVLMVKREFFLSDADFKDGICNLVSIESAGIMLDRGATDMDGEVNIELFPFYQQGDTGKSAYQEWLDLGNEGTTADFIASLRGAAFTYEDFTEEQLAALKGEKGDKMTYDDLTEEQKEELAKMVVGDAEDERRAAEIVRQENEVTREEQEAKRIETFNTNESQREDAFITAQSQMAQDFQDSQTSRNNTFTTNEDSRQETANASEALRKQTFETNEQERQSIFTANESERLVAETGRQARESSRITAENSRESAENQRRLAETARENTFAANEAQREQTFQANEAERQSTFAANEALRQEAEVVREANEKRREETYQSKVDKDDNAPKLTAGFANNLVGRGEATEEEISFRPSGGDTSIEDGTARIERLKGSTVVWNQKYSSERLITPINKATVVTENGITTITTVEGSKDGGHIGTWYQPRNRKVLISVTHSGDSFELYMFNLNYIFLAASNVVTTTNIIRKFDDVSYLNDYLLFRNRENKASTFSIYQVRIIDLTQMFGAGNEPTTIEEFNARKPLGIDEYAYNEGELISTNVDEIKSVGFNAFNGEYAKVLGGNQYELVGTYSSIGFSEEIGGELTNIEIPSDKLYTPDKDGYIYAQGADICIHLSHTGYRNGEYEPYKEFRRSIPISEIKDSDGNQLFHNGLLSAGSVYDEITATKAIKRVGVVDMGTLNWNTNTKYPSIMSIGLVGKAKNRNLLTAIYTTLNKNFLFSESSTYADKTIAGTTETNGVYVKDTSYTSAATFKAAMSGVMLYYELAEPIEVDLPEPLNLDYEVSDFGTEEIISSVPTTPMKADIIYQFNAVDRIRDNSRHTAADVTYDNAESNLSSTNVQGAIDELAEKVENISEGGGGSDEQVLAEIAFYIDINTASSKGSTRVDVGGNLDMRAMWENAKKPILMDKDGNYCELNPNDCRYTAEGEYLLNEDGTIIDKYSHCDFMELIPEYYGRIETITVNGKTILRPWLSLVPLPGGYIIPQQVVAKFKSGKVGSQMRSLPGLVPDNTKSINGFWNLAQARSKSHGLANLDFRNYMLFHVMSKYGYRDVQNAVGADGTKVFGVGLDGTESTLKEGQSDKFAVQRYIKTGATLTLGDNDGNVGVADVNGDTVHSVSVCGFENPYGQYWEMVQGLCSVGTDVYHWRGNVMPTGTPTAETFTKIDHTLLMRHTTAVWGMNIIASEEGQGVYMIPKESVSGISYGDYFSYADAGQLWLFGGHSNRGARCGLACASSCDAWSNSSSGISARLAFYGSVNKVSPTRLAELKAA